MEQPVTVGRAGRSFGGAPEVLESLVDASLTARVTLDEHGTVTGWNAGAERLLGYSAGQLTGRRAADLLAEPIPVRGGLPTLAGLPRWNGDVALRHRDGRKLTVGILAHHRPPGADAPAWLIVSALTDRQPPAGLDESLVSWSFAQSPCCAQAIYDTRLRLRRANADMERSTALTEEEMRGLRVSEISDHDAGLRAERSMARVLRTGEPEYQENYLRAPGEDHEHAWSVSISALRDHEDTVRGVCLSAHDMTEQFWARKRLQLIAEAGRRIGSTLDVTRTAQELADVTVPALADFVSVDLLAALDDAPEPPARAVPADGPLLLRRAALRSVTPGAPESVVAAGAVDSYPAGSMPFESLRTGRPALHEVTDPAFTAWLARDPARAARIRAFGIHSVMTVPLVARATTLGVAFLVRHRNQEAFQHDDLVLAGELAARAAVSIDNARRYTRERTTAVTLQRSLLPRRLPRQAAVEVASRYLPAGPHAGVGGDWFDVIPLSGARVALVVGDVVGHGLVASATMGRLRTAVRTLADIDLPCDELLTHLDDLVARLNTEEESDTEGSPAGFADTSSDVGATCLYAVYDPVTRRCSLAAAGHPVPAVVSPEGTVDLVGLPAAPPLGLSGLPYEATEVVLPEGSLLALYTNGLVEAPDRDLDTGVHRLREALARPAASLDALCDTVLADLLPQRPADDVALLIARTRALDARQVATWSVPSDPSAVAQTRKDVVAQLERWGLSDAVFVTELVVSELVTNAIRHAEPPVQLRLIHDSTLICEVSDGGNTAPHLRRARTYDEGGRGLLLVAQLTERWGTRQSAAGKTIWAEQALSPA
ncbi:serine phosphatase RsbU (regulator of sigma subunit)/PAS domain-containing protein/anti-sigma regulatory factor (Ser/Thr protein kinase) [Streptomyces luteogriseus]|uniref:SpoIIE family protein phosphatase n=1 Tax=Streptomyces luteogriseus TaxID=68233 RepID=UPI00278A7698|nr:SpoIIE family protein phosphatase [Streptomyces luteogriseus]MDQ0714534.1 serine phosphatase RsbU (regulator of sigma subunit)/PAS domain-containing protein/anti-sigma regulatory factor (Ser/Thr protein kinase) [Streptomyces luteogriseus]